MEEVQEEWRKKASKALIQKLQPSPTNGGSGFPLWIHLGNSATDFIGKFSTPESKFSIDIFDYEKISQDSTKESFICGGEKVEGDSWGIDFKVIVTSDFSTQKYQVSFVFHCTIFLMLKRV